MKQVRYALSAAVATGVLGIGLWQIGRPAATQAEPAAAASALPATQDGKVVAKSAIDAGRYIVQIAGCNDCHTPGWDRSPNQIPVSDWLTGVPVGFNGPWGTTYASNLRLYFQDHSEEEWVSMAHRRTERPPMPWASLNDMSTQDLKSVYQFVKSLGPKGQHTPDRLEPDEKPTTPYIVMVPRKP